MSNGVIKYNSSCKKADHEMRISFKALDMILKGVKIVEYESNSLRISLTSRFKLLTKTIEIDQTTGE